MSSFNIHKRNIYFKILIGIFLISIFVIISSFKSSEFNDYVIFYPQHQDDEVLWSASAIINAIENVGDENVYVCLISNGTSISVYDEHEEYKNLTFDEKFEYRNKEFLASLGELGVKYENILFLSKISNDNETDFELMKNVVLNFENKFKNVTHIGHTYKFDDHPQHIKNGLVLKTLYDENKIKDAKYFVKPKFELNILPSSKIIYGSHSKNNYYKIKNACYQYEFINKDYLREGIGYKSDYKSFNFLVNSLSNPSYLHDSKIKIP